MPNYLKYKNLRGEYVKAFFNVINWDEVAKNYEKAKK
jgi:Fe-Mn family superoxide dismutase